MRLTYYAFEPYSKANKIGPYGSHLSYYLWLISNALTVHRCTVAGWYSFNKKKTNTFALFFSHILSSSSPTRGWNSFFPLEKERDRHREIERARKKCRETNSCGRNFLSFSLSVWFANVRFVQARFVKLNSKLHFDRWSWLVIIFRWKVDII